MRPPEIESWVLSIVDRVRSKEPVEDSRVELKAEWPSDPARTARRLAGHSNAARGESVLWVIGVDEKRGVVGATDEPLQDWLSQLRPHFDSLHPEFERDLKVPVGEKTVVALSSATNRGRRSAVVTTERSSRRNSQRRRGVFA